MTELELEGRHFWRMLVTQLRAGNLLRDREAHVTRTVTRVETFCRVTFEPLAGQPDQRDYSLEGPDARQWASKGIPLQGVGGTTEAELAELEASWDRRDAAAAEGTTLYPR